LLRPHRPPLLLLPLHLLLLKLLLVPALQLLLRWMLPLLPRSKSRSGVEKATLGWPFCFGAAEYCGGR